MLITLPASDWPNTVTILFFLFSNINFDHHRSCHHHHHHHHRLITFSIHLVCVHSASFSLCICVCLRANSSSSPLVLPPDISISAYLKYSFLPHQSVSISLFLSVFSLFQQQKMARPLCPLVSACERGCPQSQMTAKVVTTRKSGDHKDHHPRHHHLQWSLSSADGQDISKLSPPLSSLSSSSPSSPSSPPSVAHLAQLTRRLRPHFFFLFLLLTSTVVVQCKYCVCLWNVLEKI